MAHLAAPVWTAATVVPMPYEKAKEITEAAKKRSLYLFGKLTQFMSHKDVKQFTNCDAFENMRPTMQLIAVDAGESGSLLPEVNTTMSNSGIGKLPRFEWKDPSRYTKSFAFIVEDLDARMESHMHHGIFYNIPPDRRTIGDEDVKISEGRNLDRLTSTALSYITTRNKDEPYVVPAPSLGHGLHRYKFTIVALTAIFIGFDRPYKVSVEDFKEEISTSVVSYGEWYGIVDGNAKALLWDEDDEEPLSPINNPLADQAFIRGRRV